MFSSWRPAFSVQWEQHRCECNTAPRSRGEREIRADRQMHRERRLQGNGGWGALPHQCVRWRWLSSLPSQRHWHCRCCRGVQQKRGNVLLYLVPEIRSTVIVGRVTNIKDVALMPSSYLFLTVPRWSFMRSEPLNVFLNASCTCIPIASVDKCASGLFGSSYLIGQWYI